MEIQINNGTKEYTLKNTYGQEIGKIYVNPTDPNFLTRMNDFEDAFKSASAKADEIQELFDKHDKKALEVMVELDTALKAEVDKLFAAKVSDIVFGATNCIATVGGIPLIERFITAILPEFKTSIFKEQKAQQARISKYTKRYHK